MPESDADGPFGGPSPLERLARSRLSTASITSQGAAILDALPLPLDARGLREVQKALANCVPEPSGGARDSASLTSDESASSAISSTTSRDERWPRQPAQRLPQNPLPDLPKPVAVYAVEPTHRRNFSNSSVNSQRSQDRALFMPHVRQFSPRGSFSSTLQRPSIHHGSPGSSPAHSPVLIPSSPCQIPISPRRQRPPPLSMVPRAYSPRNDPMSAPVFQERSLLFSDPSPRTPSRTSMRGSMVHPVLIEPKPAPVKAAPPRNIAEDFDWNDGPRNHPEQGTNRLLDRLALDPVDLDPSAIRPGFMRHSPSYSWDASMSADTSRAPSPDAPSSPHTARASLALPNTAVTPRRQSHHQLTMSAHQSTPQSTRRRNDPYAIAMAAASGAATPRQARAKLSVPPRQRQPHSPPRLPAPLPYTQFDSMSLDDHIHRGAYLVEAGETAQGTLHWRYCAEKGHLCGRLLLGIARYARWIDPTSVSGANAAIELVSSVSADTLLRLTGPHCPRIAHALVHWADHAPPDRAERAERAYALAAALGSAAARQR